MSASSAGTSLAGLGRAIGEGKPDETRQRFEELSAQIDDLRSTLGYFSVSKQKPAPAAEVPREATIEDLTPVG